MSSRVEELLAAAIDGSGTDGLDPPQSRNEKLLFALNDKLDNVQSELTGKVDVPADGQAYQQLVTDADGNVKWEDRPFYTGDFEIGESLIDSLDISCSGGYYKGTNITTNFEEGLTYAVNWDGIKYTCKCYYAEGPNTPAIGNGSLCGVSGGNSEPFYIQVLSGYLWVFDDVKSTHTVSINRTIQTIHTIPREYLPKYALIGAPGTGVDSEVFNNESNRASGTYSHAEGSITTASGNSSHAEGATTTASGNRSHAEGESTEARGTCSHAEGYGTCAFSDYQHVQGKYSIKDTINQYIHIVGNGISDKKRSNAHTIDWSGNAWFAGKVEGTAIILKSATTDSTKRFEITVDDTGTISATEVDVTTDSPV